MKKHIVLICEGGQQFGVVVEELSVSKVMKRIIEDLSNPSKVFVNFADYAPPKDSNQGLYVKSSIVGAVTVVDISNIQTPNKKIYVPGGVKPN